MAAWSVGLPEVLFILGITGCLTCLIKNNIRVFVNLIACEEQQVCGGVTALTYAISFLLSLVLILGAIRFALPFLFV